MTPLRQGYGGQAPTQEWHHVDAKNKVLGRLATKLASLLIGKHRRDYAPNKIAPVYIVVTNTDHVTLTGNKEVQKKYYRYSGYPGGMKSRTVADQRRRDSRRLIEAAVFGMLPKNSLRDKRILHLKLYPGADHPHMPQLNVKKES